MGRPKPSPAIGRWSGSAASTLKLEYATLRLAMADPLDQATIQDAELRTSKWITTLVAPETAILKTLDRLYPRQDEAA